MKNAKDKNIWYNILGSVTMKDDLFDYLVATDEIDNFLGYRKKEENKMGFFDKDDDELEERMNYLDLEEWQKDLVREGKYDPENFEEDDSSDEDDYYHEDDE